MPFWPLPGKHSVANPSAHSDVPLSLQRKRSHRIWRDFILSVLFTLLVIGAKDLFQKTRPGAYLEDIARDWLEFNLAQHKGSSDPHIVVVDISSFGPTPRHPYTDRTKLLQVIQAVVSHSPRAIGVDVDFSPIDSQPSFVPEEDSKFLGQCAALKKQIPGGLFVGVSGPDVLKHPDTCLGSSQFCSLAAYIDHPNAETLEMAEMDAYIDVLHTTEDGGFQAWRYPSLSAAVADYTHDPTPPRGFGWAIEPAHLVQEPETDPFNIQHTRFVVDFSRIDDLETHHTIFVPDEQGPAYIRGDDRLNGNVTVFLGVVKNAGDSEKFAVPGQSERYPGVFLHASAAYTLMQAKNRLWLLTTKGGWALDALASVLIFGSIAMIRLHYNRRIQQNVAVLRLNSLFTWSIIITLFVAFVVFISWTRVFWEDFPLVLLGLLVHSRLERGAEAAPAFVRRLWSSWRSVVFTDSTKADE